MGDESWLKCTELALEKLFETEYKLFVNQVISYNLICICLNPEAIYRLIKRLSLWFNLHVKLGIRRYIP
jgi:hypothetical protein